MEYIRQRSGVVSSRETVRTAETLSKNDVKVALLGTQMTFAAFGLADLGDCEGGVAVAVRGRAVGTVVKQHLGSVRVPIVPLDGVGGLGAVWWLLDVNEGYMAMGLEIGACQAAESRIRTRLNKLNVEPAS